jgi:hypothetical protein
MKAVGGPGNQLQVIPRHHLSTPLLSNYSAIHPARKHMNKSLWSFLVEISLLVLLSIALSTSVKI